MLRRTYIKLLAEVEDIKGQLEILDPTNKIELKKQRLLFRRLEAIYLEVDSDTDEKPKLILL